MSWDFAGVSERDIGRYTAVLEAARNARPTPLLSNYFVRGAAMTRSGKLFSGGNHEYSIGNAIHCEETLVARVLEEAGSDDPIAVVGFLDQSFDPGNVLYPCGNCRDVLLPHSESRTVIVDASIDGGPVAIKPLQDILYEPKRRVAISDLTVSDLHALAMAEHQRTQSLLSHLPRNKHDQVYGAAAITVDGEIFSARYVGGGCYHGSNALWNVLVRAQDSAPIAKVFVTGPLKPSVPYKDRQRLAEFAANENRGREIAVLLAKTRNQYPVQAWKTDSTEWIPKTFVLTLPS